MPAGSEPAATGRHTSAPSARRRPLSSVSTANPPGWVGLPESLQAPAQSLLQPGEQPLACLVVDVDPTRHFRQTLLLLTNSRLLSVPVSPSGDLEFSAAAEWPLADIVRLKTFDRGGLGTLELLGDSSRLAVWHYTIGHGPQVLALIEQLEQLKHPAGEQSGPADSTEPPEAETFESPPDTRALFRLAQFAWPHGQWILVGLLLSIGGTIASLVPPALVKPLMDDILAPAQTVIEARQAAQAAGWPAPDAPAIPFGSAGWYLTGLFLAAAAAWLLNWAQAAVLAAVSERVTADMRNRTYSHLQKLSLEYFGGKRTGDLMSRVSTDTDRLCSFMGDSLVDFIADALLVIGTAAVLLWWDPRLAIVSLLPFPFISWLMYKSRQHLQHGFQSSSRAWGHMTSVLADTIPGIRVVKAFAQENREIDRFAQANDVVVQANMRVNAVWTFFWPMIGFFNRMGVLVVWACGVWLVYRNFRSGGTDNMTVGDLVAFVAYITQFYGRLEMMSRFVNSSERAAASAQRIFEVLDRVSSVPEPARPVPLARLKGELEFRGVGFRYGNRKVMHDLTLKIAPGEMIGLVGHTGAGKSTLINLVCRFFDVAEGVILADGVDIRSYHISDYRRNVGIVLQEPFLFFGTIAENIAYGRPDATRPEIIAAAQAARAHQFILQLPDGYDSLVGERGQSLSGGERQRISIARALLIDPRILILDEATSAVDTQTEREIQEALQNLIHGRTTIAIAHRLSTLRQADRIVVLDRGRIVEVGTHEELLARAGVYAGLHRAQQELTRDIGL